MSNDIGYGPLFPLGADDTEYRQLDVDGVKVEKLGGRDFVTVQPNVLSELAETAFSDISHLFRPAHLKQLRLILDDPEASDNDRFVALELLKNANISAAMEFPSCQDTGTAIISGKKGQQVLVDGDDAEALSAGVQKTWATRNLRYSQMAPLSMFEEKNTGSNLPAQIDLEAVGGDAYKFLFIAKGGGSANKTFLYQETRRVLDPQRLLQFFAEKLPTLGTAACPPYHLSIVIGGMSAEQTLKTVKMVSCKYLDGLPTSGDMRGHGLPRPGTVGTDPQAVAEPGHRRTVRRQVLLPRRAGHPPAPPRRIPAHRHRGFLLCRSPGQGQDHRRRRLHGSAGA